MPRIYIKYTLFLFTSWVKDEKEMLDNPFYPTYFCNLTFYIGNIFPRFILLTFSDKILIIDIVAAFYNTI